MKNGFVLVCLALFIHTLCLGDLFVESFESGFALSDWDTSQGDVGWQFNSDIASDGTKSLSTDASIQTGQTAILEISIETNRIKFDFNGAFSSGDRAYFYVNDELGRQIVSSSNWTTHTQNLEFGLHTFKWVFEYNSSSSNRFFAIDNIRFGDEFVGNGTKTSPYLIHNVGELNKIALEPDYQFYKNKHFRLNNNISLYNYGHVSGEPDSVSFEYNIIGSSNDPFLGNFDGNGYAITDFKYHSNTSPTESEIGIFGYLGESAVVENLSVEGFGYYGRYTIGGIAAVNNGTIRNCSAQGTITAYGQYGNAAGGITALNRGLIKNCTVDIGIVSDYGRVGGIAAQNLGGRIIDCTATNDIVVNDQNVSGIAENVATATKGAVISGCTAINNRLESTGSGSNGNNVGGISSQNPAFCTIVNCQSSGVVKGRQYIGGLVGKNAGLVLASSSSAQVVYGYGSAGGAIGDNETTGLVRYSYATGSVGSTGGTGGYATGGFCGTAGGTFRHCFSTGEVEKGSSSSWTFGFAYPSNSPEIIGCFFDRTKAGVGAYLTNTTENPSRDAYPLYSASGEMTQQDKFEEKEWDFGYVWKIGSQSPELRAIWHYAFVYRDNPTLIDEFELQGLIYEWLMDRSRDNHTQVTADYNKDGVVDLLDWAALANLWTARNQNN